MTVQPISFVGVVCLLGTYDPVQKGNQSKKRYGSACYPMLDRHDCMDPESQNQDDVASGLEHSANPIPGSIGCG